MNVNIAASVELRPNGRLVLVYEVPALISALEVCDSILHPGDAPALALTLLEAAVEVTSEQRPLEWARLQSLREAVACARRQQIGRLKDPEDYDQTCPT
jgi:hypothetical protein